MNTLTIRNFRSNLASSFNRANQGENVFIRRNNEVYALIRIADDNIEVSADLLKQIDAARKSYHAGNYVSCSNHEQLDELLNSL